MDELETTIKAELDIDDTNLEGELKRQAGKYFYWGTLKAKAAQRVRQERSRLDTAKAQEAKTFKDDLAAVDPKTRVTERMLDDYLDLHDGIKERKAAFVEAQYTEELLDIAVDAFRQRHYAIVELVKGKESERMVQNEFALMKKDFEAREAKKRG